MSIAEDSWLYHNNNTEALFSGIGFTPILG